MSIIQGISSSGQFQTFTVLPNPRLIALVTAWPVKKKKRKKKLMTKAECLKEDWTGKNAFILKTDVFRDCCASQKC